MKINDLQYCPDTGAITWPSGTEAGYIDSHGYNKIVVAQKNYYGHRLAWYLTHGEWPAEQIDHINGNRADNRLCNLREATNQKNSMNRTMQSNNKSGVTGVSWDKTNEKWVCRIRNGDTYQNLGRFACLDKATEAIEAAKIKYGYSPRHGTA